MFVTRGKDKVCVLKSVYVFKKLTMLLVNKATSQQTKTKQEFAIPTHRWLVDWVESELPRAKSYFIVI